MFDDCHLVDPHDLCQFVGAGCIGVARVLHRHAQSTQSPLLDVCPHSLVTRQFFLNNALAINLPGSGVLPWLRQTVIIILPLWFHLTLLLLPERARLTPLNILGLSLAYVTAGVLISIGVFDSALLSDATVASAVFTSGRTAGPLYPVFVIFLILLGSLALFNLWRGRMLAPNATLRRRFSSLLIASSLTGAGALYTSLGIGFHLNIPTLPGDAAMGAGVILLGYAVARYNAFLEGRRIERDFLYTALAVGSLTTFYVAVTLGLYLGGQISFFTLALTIVGTLAFNTLYDGVRVALDRLFYHGQFQRLRTSLRAMAHEIDTEESLSEQLDAILTALCDALRIRKGFIALRDGSNFVIAATHEADPVGHELPLQNLSANEIIGLVRPDRKDLEGMVLLIPLYGGDAQTGAMVLGEKENKRPYSEQDFEFFDDLAEITSLIHALRRQEEHARNINAMVDEYRERERALNVQIQTLLAESQKAPEPIQPTQGEGELLPLVEEGLRRLYDFAYLGESALAKLSVVDARIDKQKSAVIFVDQGKAVNEILLHALDKLRPMGEMPKSQQIPSREWHQFIILHDSYVDQVPNRDIMSRLYISEGTFNRTRRRALRTVAHIVQEMEQTARLG